MTKQINYENILIPAVNILTATGRERNPCFACEIPVKENEKIVEIAKGSYKNKLNFDRYHYKCFLQILAINFPDVLFDKELRKEVILAKLK